MEIFFVILGAIFVTIAFVVVVRASERRKWANAQATASKIIEDAALLAARLDSEVAA